MIRIVWTHQAIQDVQAIRAYIGRDSARYAALVAEQIVEAINRLTNFPTSGRRYLQFFMPRANLESLANLEMILDGRRHLCTLSTYIQSRGVLP